MREFVVVSSAKIAKLRIIRLTTGSAGFRLSDHKRLLHTNSICMSVFYRCVNRERIQSLSSHFVNSSISIGQRAQDTQTMQVAVSRVITVRCACYVSRSEEASMGLSRFVKSATTVIVRRCDMIYVVVVACLVLLY